jgi:hypothetical protein
MPVLFSMSLFVGGVIPRCVVMFWIVRPDGLRAARL